MSKERFPGSGVEVPQLTELEGAALAVVGQHARPENAKSGCTAYRIKRAFETSPSAYWSGSAGAVYPLVERLVERGLLLAQRVREDGRGARTLRLTAPGERALSAWVRDVERAIAPGVDPLRTRLHLLPAVRVDGLTDLLDAFEDGLRRQLADPPAPPGAFHDRAQALYRTWTQARLRWLQEARQQGLFEIDAEDGAGES